MIIWLVFVFLIWLSVAIAYGTIAQNPAGNRYKWLIGWPLGLVLIIAVALRLDWLVALPLKYFSRENGK